MGKMTFSSLLLGCVLATVCLAQPYFLRKDTIVGLHPTAVITGDFNGDGRVDLAIGTEDGLFVLLNSGNGDFGSPIPTQAPPGLFWLSKAADFNGDGKDDVIGSGLLFLGRGDGTFLPPQPIGAQEVVAAGDFNRDGKMDLVIADYGWSNGGFQTSGVRILLGNGDGIFRPGAKITDRAAVQLRMADFNGDGLADVAMLPVPGVYANVAANGSTTLLVFLGHADGTFSSEIRTTVPASSQFWTQTAFLVADFNSDKLPDVVTGAGVMLGKGDGTFQSPIACVLPGPWFPVAAADLTGDGFADLIMSYEPYSLAICPGKGDGTILAPMDVSIAAGSSYLNIGIPADLGGDGHLDLITVNYFLNSISALMTKSQDSPALRRAVSAAGDVAIVAPESLATLFVSTPATSAIATPPWPTSLGGISLEVRDSAGTSRLAPLLFVSDSHINFQVPAGTTLGEATLAVVSAKGATVAGSMEVETQAPGIFMAYPNSQVPAANGVLVNPDGTQTPVEVYACDELGCGLLPIPLSTTGDRSLYLSFYGTGFAGLSKDKVTCSINGVDVPIVYAGPQAASGVEQINIRLTPEILQTLTAPYDNLATAVIRVNGMPANSFSLLIQ